MGLARRCPDCSSDGQRFRIIPRGAGAWHWLIRFCLPLSAVALLCTFETVSARTVEGQVFVATHAGSAVKLALAEVYVLSRDHVAEMEKSSRATAARVTAVAKQNVEKLEEDLLRKMESESRKYVEAAERNLAERRKTGTPQQIQTAEFNLSEERKTQEAYRESARMAVARDLVAGRLIIHRAAESEILRARFKPPAGTTPVTRSDADGNFTAEIPEGSAILVLVERVLPTSGREELRWFLWTENLTKGGRVLFSNHNWFGTDTPGQVALNTSGFTLHPR